MPFVQSRVSFTNTVKARTISVANKFYYIPIVNALYSWQIEMLFSRWCTIDNFHELPNNTYSYVIKDMQSISALIT